MRRLLRRPIFIIGGTLAVLLIGVAITRLTIHDLVPVDATLAQCVDAGVNQQYDNPIERFALRLGKSRVTKTVSGGTEVESFTLFRIPIGALRGRADEKMLMFCHADGPGEIEISGSFLPEPDSLPSGWFAHRMNDTAVLITKHEELPDIGATEGYAYGEQVGVSVATTDLSPQAWTEEQEWLNDEALVRSKTWTELRGHALLRIQHETEASAQLTHLLFVDGRVYTISLYPYPAAEDAVVIVNALLETYAE